MDEHKCPLCGKDTVNNEIFCRDCQEIANNSYPDELLAEHEIAEVIEEADIPTESIEDELVIEEAIAGKEHKSSKTKVILLLSVLLLCILIGGAGSYLYMEDKEANETEAAFWDRCIEDNTPLSYSKYLVQYPSGKFSEQAHQKILSLRKQESDEWEVLRTSGDLNAYSAFLIDHPGTPHTANIRAAMDSLSWTTATSEDTPEAYLAYLNDVNLGNLPGDYQALAQERYDYLSQLKTVDGEELAVIKANLGEFFQKISSKKFGDMTKFMAPVVVNFFGVEGKSKEVIATSVEADIKERKIKNLTYILNTASLEVIKDNKGIYFIETPLVRQITYNDRKKKKEEAKLSVCIELNKDKLLQTLYEKK